MRIRTLFIISALTFILGGCASQKITREDIEWSNFRWNNESDRSKPRVLFIGNSISKGYVPQITSQLNGVANCDHLATSRNIKDPALYKETKIAMAKYKHAIIHFNNGLHGWHLNAEQYEEGLQKYVRFLKSNKAKGCILVYSQTTPVPSKVEGIKLDPIRNEFVLERNRIAMKIMEENDIPVIDLYGLMEPDLEKYSASKGDLHYKKEGYKKMSEKISDEILKLLNDSK